MASGTGMLLVYIIGWGIVFGTFVHYYHKRKSQALTKLSAWYPTHPERSIYYSLLTLQATTSVPPETLRAALFRRAMTDIMRAVDIKSNKQTLQSLVKSGAMSEELTHQFEAAEAENDAEMMSVVQEAEKLQKGWGGSIFYAASEMVNNTRLRELREEMLRLDFESANCVRMVMMDRMSDEERKRATTEGTEENDKLVKNDIILSSIFNMPIGEGVKIAQAAQAKRLEAAKKAKVGVEETESAKVEVIEAEMPKAEVEEVESVEVATESPKAEVTETESPKVEVTKTESPKAEVTKTESPKAEVTKTESPKAEVTETEAKEPVAAN
ncbi:translocation protein Sec66 [Coemansia sp. RSA 2523]|nr:translocation protein Sec66 [Coemansia sp. RSA 1824]KAJ1793297.1 translocation protein Sec66 [Coemansia sp. RSA 2167]KAJ1811005.1 translocation protein Sec66 [Coemansia sp. RSA 2523]KAJ2133582.1 translocation protein Sec66 [Coemansia sp. RSA 921]KAJ2135005.1 translocation protein Sec66 [Coemansia sp. RSA 788]KAJ2148721.1 translocation protein Sec66 [Coemansia sp. RSA 564]KAJ2169831.1 translocation protein Sec66 [Coemansia sp. RSA 562]KAJ2170782.1 translocation protein Sec66 [Coemansia sp.